MPKRQEAGVDADLLLLDDGHIFHHLLKTPQSNLINKAFKKLSEGRIEIGGIFSKYAFHMVFG